MATKIKIPESELIKKLDEDLTEEIASAEIVRGATAKPIAFRASAPLLAELDQLAERAHRSRANLITHILWQYVHNKKSPA